MTQATQTIPKGYKQTEIGVIPEDWDLSPLGKLCTYQNGMALEKYFNKQDGLKVISIGNYSEAGKFVETNSYIDKKYFNELKRFVLNKNDLTMILNDKTAVGTIIGKVLYIENDEKYIFNQRTMRLTSKANIDPKFLYFQINGSRTHRHIVGLSKPGTQIYVNTNDIIELPIACPKSKEEQTAIATALSDTDALIEKLEKLIDKKKAVKQGAMQQLLTGKKRLPGFSGEWDKKPVQEIGKTYGGLSGKVKADFGEGNSYYIPFMNIMSNPIIDITYFDKVNIKTNETQAKAQKNDLFFNGSSETPEEVGMCSVLLNEIPNLYLNSFCFGFRLNKDLETDGLWLSYFFRSSIGRELIYSLAQGATRYNLSKTNFLKLIIPYPEPEEQTAIATVLSDMDAEIEKLENKIGKYRQIKTGMMQQLLTGKIRLLKN